MEECEQKHVNFINHTAEEQCFNIVFLNDSFFVFVCADATSNTAAAAAVATVPDFLH